MKIIPPTTATWMLRHLVLGRRNEALEGDLLEEFQRRRSVDWYWRQVLGAIFGFSNMLRVAWMTVSAALIAGVWVYGNCVIFCIAHHASLQMAFLNWTPYPPNPIWLAGGIVINLAPPLILYLALSRNLSLRTFTVGLGAGVLVIVALHFFQSHLATPLNYLLAYGLAYHWNVTVWLSGGDLLQGCLPLVAAVWAATLSKIKTGSVVP